MSNIIRRLMDNMKLLLICILGVLLSHPFLFFRFRFINVYIDLFLFDNLIYVFLSVMTMYSRYIFIYDYPDWSFSVHFPQLQGKCQGRTHKDRARPALFLIFVLFYVYLCSSMYCLFCVVLCIVCVFMRTEQLPPFENPIAVNKYISYHIISYHIISYHIISYHIISYHII